MMANKWVQAALAGGFCIGLWIGFWIAMAFGPETLFYVSFWFAAPVIYLTLRARSSESEAEAPTPAD